MMPTSSAERRGETPISLQYAGCTLDRAHPRRDDAEWLQRAHQAPDTGLIPVFEDQNLTETGRSGPRLARVAAQQIGERDTTVFLGLEAGTAMFAVAVDEASARRLAQITGGTFEPLRRIGPALSPADAALAAYAKGMLYWHQTHGFCPRCGAATQSRRGGHERQCENPKCARRHFPRTDPAVIMLVEHPDRDGGGPRCLLGRSNRFPPNVYSTLAGFVEPGETLEQAVAREVREESGIEIQRAEYVASQPWPFPASLMLGFRALAASVEIRLEDDEIEDARWFTPDQLRSAGDWGSGASLCLPRRDSIARMLIEQWLARARY